MDSRNDENRESLEIEESNSAKPSSSHITSSRRTLLSNDNPENNSQATLATPRNRFKFLEFSSAASKFKQLAQHRNEISRSSHGFCECSNSVFSRNIDWFSVMRIIEDPMNLALFVWFLCVAVSGAILFLVMTGMLNSVLPKKLQRDVWFEVNNQILNALLTLMSLFQHPKRFFHLVLLCRWKSQDIFRLRKIYCQNGTYKPHEWMHMMVVVLLLHLNCFAQYAFCGLNLGYKRSERPVIGVGICISLAIAAPVIAGVYAISSPLGRDYEFEMDEEAQIDITSGESKRDELPRSKSIDKSYFFATRDVRRVETTPSWSGGVLNLWDDISLVCLSLFCSFCIFGWNMERLGFGNMYVHIATFLLFCTGPFWIIYLASLHINNESVREALGLSGIILCVFGLLYGGFWRIQMRKRFHLPSYTFCFRKPSVSDCMVWLCCCWCSLAQEVRTGNSYDIVEDTFRRKHVGSSNLLQPFPSKSVSGTSSPPNNIPIVNIELTVGRKDEIMIPPSPLVIETRDA
ncbi:PLAC8 family protein [Euphorbia peplus]|nr:PLAC8 family protein [Euphorbia peplus]